MESISFVIKSLLQLYHKQRYKPSYTLIPLASSGYYDISQNDLVDLETEAKKNINLPVLNDTRAMSNLTNFKITL